uniref:Uncharacterized protein n=1 Tax=Siphoviridae sp. ctcx61 TaxID=2825575 RepID=A0A8S5TWL9_9CAUD|nr:MAG TPA: hypothetical protein [Siphoviridae sp. ctcx61]
MIPVLSHDVTPSYHLMIPVLSYDGLLSKEILHHSYFNISSHIII